MSRPDFSSPLVIVAVGIAGGAVLWGIGQVLPAIAEALGILISAVAASVGLVIAVATTGFATAGTFPMFAHIAVATT